MDLSKLNVAYKFKSIHDIEKFIIENKHLPEITPIASLKKTANGYCYNLTDLSMQSLEKIDEQNRKIEKIAYGNRETSV